jgi:hypothetical protein
MSTLSWTKLDEAYNSVSNSMYTPNIILTTVKGYQYIKALYAPIVIEEEIEPFDEWVGQIRAEAHKPHNHSTREFLDRRYHAGRYRR